MGYYLAISTHTEKCFSCSLFLPLFFGSIRDLHLLFFTAIKRSD